MDVGFVTITSTLGRNLETVANRSDDFVTICIYLLHHIEFFIFI